MIDFPLAIDPVFSLVAHVRKMHGRHNQSAEAEPERRCDPSCEAMGSSPNVRHPARGSPRMGHTDEERRLGPSCEPSARPREPYRIGFIRERHLAFDRFKQGLLGSLGRAVSAASEATLLFTCVTRNWLGRALCCGSTTRVFVQVNGWSHPLGAPVDALSTAIAPADWLGARGHSGSGPLVYVLSGGNEVGLWDVEEGRCRQVFTLCTFAALPCLSFKHCLIHLEVKHSFLWLGYFYGFSCSYFLVPMKPNVFTHFAAWGVSRLMWLKYVDCVDQVLRVIPREESEVGKMEPPAALRAPHQPNPPPQLSQIAGAGDPLRMGISRDLAIHELYMPQPR